MAVVANVAINVDAKGAISQLNAVDAASTSLNKSLQTAAVGAKGLGAAIQSALGPLLAVSTAVAAVQKGLNTAFERGAAEQRLKNLSNTTAEYEAALGAAAASADKFGMSQTETTKALADVYGRLKGVGFGLKETVDIYEGFNIIAKQSGLTASDAAGTFFQLSQALGKGKLNGDEFVSVSERMPQLLDAIATATGKSRSELSAMAQDGQITSEVLYRALASSASGADGLNNKLTDQQKAFNNLAQIGDRLSNILGQVFAPFVVKGAEMLAAAGQKISEWYEYIGNVVFPKVRAALQPLIQSLQTAFADINFDAVRVFLQNVLLKGFEVATVVVGKFSTVLAFVIDRFKQLSQNPVFKFIADQVGRLVSHLGLSNDRVTEFANEQEKAKQKAAETASQYSSMPEKIQKVSGELKIKSARIDENKAKYEQLVGQVEQEVKSLERGNQVIQSRIGIASAENELYGAQLERQYELATTADQRLAIAKKMFEQQVQAAKLEYESAVQSNELLVRKSELEARIAEIKYDQLAAQREIAIAEAEINGATKEQIDKLATGYNKQLSAQGDLVTSAYDQVAATREIADNQNLVADAVYKTKIVQAEGTLAQKLTSKEIGLSKEQADKLAGSLGAGAYNANQLAGALGTVTQRAREAVVELSRVQNVSPSNVTPQSGYEATYNYSDGTTGYASIQAAYAQGGYVTGPTRAVIGEGGESEYVIPASKMSIAMARYASGQRGDAVIPGGSTTGAGGDMGSTSINPMINVTTGPVMNMNGSNYVTQRDFVAGLQTASRRGAEMALSAMRSNGGIRRSIGAR